MQLTLILGFLVAPSLSPGTDTPPTASRAPNGSATYRPEHVPLGVKLALHAVTSCSYSGHLGRRLPTVDDLADAKKGDHVCFVFGKPVPVTLMRETIEVSEIVFANGGFLLRNGDRVWYASKYTYDKILPFHQWILQPHAAK